MWGIQILFAYVNDDRGDVEHLRRGPVFGNVSANGKHKFHFLRFFYIYVCVNSPVELAAVLVPLDRVQALPSQLVVAPQPGPVPHGGVRGDVHGEHPHAGDGRRA